MKNLLFSLTMIVCCMCFTLPANAEVKIDNYDACTLVTTHDAGWLFSETSYSLTCNGRTVLEPVYGSVEYNDELHLMTFVYLDDVMYRVSIYSTESGKCVYSGLWRANSYAPSVSYRKDGKYVSAVVNHSGHFDNGKTVAGKFYRKDGRTYQLSTKQVTYDKQL